MTTYVDAAGAVKEWINSLSATLVGAGHPMQLGASLKMLTGAQNTPYGYVLEISTGLWGGHENPSMSARISVQVFGPTKQAASDAAVAYAQELMPLLQGQRAYLPEHGVWLAGADNIDGPTWFPGANEEPRYVVDCDYLFT